MEIRAITDFDLVGGKQEMVAILQDGCRASISLQLNVNAVVRLQH